VASCFSARYILSGAEGCILSCTPFCCGFPGSIPGLVRQDRQLRVNAQLDEPYRQLRQPR
jgi:hypothetical protein